MLKKIKIEIDKEIYTMAIDTENSLFSMNEWLKVYELYIKDKNIKVPDNAIIYSNVRCPRL